jgi:serine/threonine protein kinase
LQKENQEELDNHNGNGPRAGRQQQGSKRKCAIDENQLRVLWQQMLRAVDSIHDERIVHGDLKPANFMFVQGNLKLIDFGIAKGHFI